MKPQQRSSDIQSAALEPRTVVRRLLRATTQRHTQRFVVFLELELVAVPTSENYCDKILIIDCDDSPVWERDSLARISASAALRSAACTCSSAFAGRCEAAVVAEVSAGTSSTDASPPVPSRPST